MTGPSLYRHSRVVIGMVITPFLLFAFLAHRAGALPGLARPLADGEVEEKWLVDYIQEMTVHNHTDDVMLADSPASPPVQDAITPQRPSCPPTPDYFPASRCQWSVCRSDEDCSDTNERCCFNGCVDTCTTSVPSSPVIDWLREPPTKISGRSWLIEEELDDERNPENEIDEPCSTSKLVGDPLLCPHGYVCRVTYRGDHKKGIPNQGRCVPQTQREQKGKT